MGEMHHLSVGCADCAVIKSDNHTFLIDCHGIENHSHLLPASKYIKAVFITHQHYDHFDGLDYLKKNGYSIGSIIHAPYERRYNDASVRHEEWQSFQGYVKHFTDKGTTVHAPYRQKQFENPWWEIDGLKFFILGPATHIAKAETRELHDACLVICARLKARKCLFTGDASDTSLKYISDNTNNICDDILHASHHGSINGADLEFIKKCCAEYTVISTKSGVHDNVPSSTALQRYRNNTSKIVYRTDTDGSLKWSF
ncbi:ComEC/Rec2 family competence protein [Geomonas propionica]|uniref:MBL fold metallo-hydrolase n=1 Tax=Geomonas propionica TaxID=2798582 RepID=A0ABS0YVT2_9BACT|nr:MBL fold metallo-hydrolase [Geomonas propionica]MBJ6802061.1 MBL fold metallo-hydrolase [Geomonas propionica]